MNFKHPFTAINSFTPLLMDVVKKVHFSCTATVLHYDQTPIDIGDSWQQVARDRVRFKNRMMNVEQSIGWVFASKHRDCIIKKLHELYLF